MKEVTEIETLGDVWDYLDKC